MNAFTRRFTRVRDRAVQTQPRTFSNWSTPAVPDSAWCSNDILLGAGMVILQPSTEKVVVLYDTKHKVWFLPKGRKDIGESLEQAALREAYEESGYRVEFMPLYTNSRAPRPSGEPPGSMSRNTEAIYVTTTSWNRGEYLSFYYVGQIPEDAVQEEGTRMPDEQFYVTHLLSIQEAWECLKYSQEWFVVEYAWKLWQSTIQKDAEQAHNARQRLSSAPSTTSVLSRN